MTESFRYDSAPQRRQVILDALRSSGFVAISDLTRDLGVSDMTIRRDLRKLEESDQVRVVRGGVSLPRGSLHAPGFEARAARSGDAKRAIAIAAAALVPSTATIAVDAGTTAYALVEELTSAFAGTVVTNSLPAIQLMLSRGDARVVCLGGEVLVESQACAGQMAVDAAAGLSAHTYFLGAAALDERGAYVASDLERPTKHALMAVCTQVVLLADSAKFRATAPVLLASLDAIDMLVTDAPPPRKLAAALAAADVQVLIA